MLCLASILNKPSTRILFALAVIRTSLRLFFALTLFLGTSCFVLASAIFCPPRCFFITASLLLALALKSCAVLFLACSHRTLCCTQALGSFDGLASFEGSMSRSDPFDSFLILAGLVAL
eukprot:jgi/Chrpa1/21369/Chrysochromulina_OHIO_Genome00025500-RA